jgi:hypothetical protein
MKRTLVFALALAAAAAADRPAQAAFRRGAHVRVGFFGRHVFVPAVATSTVAAPPVLVGPLTPAAPAPAAAASDPALAAQLQLLAARLAALEVRQAAPAPVAVTPVAVAPVRVAQLNTLPAVQQLTFLTGLYGVTAGRALFVTHGGAFAVTGRPVRGAVFVRAPFVRIRVR